MQTWQAQPIISSRELDTVSVTLKILTPSWIREKAQSLPKAEAKGGASRTQRSWRELQKKADGKTLKIIAINWKAPQGLFILWVRQLKTERLELVQDHT